MDETTRQLRRIVPRDLPPTAPHSTEANPKQSYGDRKVALALFPTSAIIYGALAMMEGARKYNAYNWRDQPVEAMTYAHASLRHLLAWIDGEDIDPDSGNPHLGHFLACVAILIDATETGNLIDNRPRRGKAAELLLRYQRRS